MQCYIIKIGIYHYRASKAKVGMFQRNLNADPKDYKVRIERSGIDAIKFNVSGQSCNGQSGNAGHKRLSVSGTGTGPQDGLPNALVICNHVPQPRGIAGSLIFVPANPR